jgi:hypothetical protein
MIEDEMFAKALEIIGIRRTKKMYHKAKLLHHCSMCDNISEPSVGYALNLDKVSGFDTPYLYICPECYEELPEE